MADDDFLLKLQKTLANEGKLVEAGWVGFRLVVIPKGAPARQLEDMKMAFMAGSMHLFTAMMGVMDPDAEPTDDDIDRMDKIHNELEAYAAQFKLRYGRTEGSG